MLLQRAPEAFGRLAELLAGSELSIEASALRVTTQEPTQVGRPDLVLIQDDALVIFIEIKHDSPLSPGQLERYLDELNLREESHKQLVLLTRSKHSRLETALDPSNYRQVCWYQISGLLSELEVEDEIASYVIDQFQEFLRHKEMSMEKIEWEYIRGVPALRHFVNMVGTALAEALPDARVRNTSGWSWIGYYFSGKSWVGIRYEDSLTLLVEKESNEDPKPKRLLDLEKEHFFSLDAGKQLELLSNFIKTSVSELEIDPHISPTNEPDDD